MRNISTTNRSEAWGMMIRIKTSLVVQVLKIWVDHAVALFLLCQQHMAVHRQTLSGCQVSRRWCLDLEGKPSPEKMYFWQSIWAPLSTRHGEVTTKSQFSQITQLLLLFLLHTLRFYRFLSLSFSLFVRQKRFNGLSFLGPGNPLHQHLVSLSSLSCQTSVCLIIPSCALSSVRLSVWVSVPWWCLSPPPALRRSCGAVVL